MSTLSLCMIVKDEAAMLPAFLEAARGLYDQLCVVDTGSTDGTLQILEKAGAVIRRCEWRNDFAWARNQSLELATSDWVLVLDPDERVTPQLIDSVRRCIEDPSAGAATVRMHNGMEHGHLRISPLLRMFRRSPHVAFRYAIHEEVTRDVEAELQRTGQRLVHLEGAVHHLGYQPERMKAKDKRRRDAALLEACIQKDPDDAYSHFKRLELARYHQDAKLLKTAAASAMAMLERRGPSHLSGMPFGAELVGMMADALHPADAQRALSFFETWSKAAPISAAGKLREGELREQMGDGEGAERCFRDCLALKRHLGNLQCSSTRPLLGLARLSWADGNLPQALRCASEALQEAPSDLEAITALLMLTRSLGGAPAQKTFVDSYVALHGQTAALTQAFAEVDKLERRSR